MNKNKERLLNLSGSLAREAKSIINDLKLIEKWEHLGKPVVVGSVAFDLVMDRDIDLDIYACKIDLKKSFQLMSDIALNDKVVKIIFINDKNNRSKWLYWEIQYEFNERRTWKIEIYYTGPGDPYYRWPERFADRMNECLTKEKRIIILFIKDQLIKNGQNDKIKSFYIYKSVMENRVKTYADFIKWHEKNRTNGILPWIPGLKE